MAKLTMFDLPQVDYSPAPESTEPPLTSAGVVSAFSSVDEIMREQLLSHELTR